MENGRRDSRSEHTGLITEPEKQDLRQHFNLTGWRFTVITGAISTCVVLIINLGLLIFSVTKFGPVKDGIPLLFQGSCSKVNNLNTWLHALINILSTVLLGASNYSMQCLSAPTRRDVDKAHSKGIWLDIGIPSLRNLSRISFRRALLWWLLALSSLPLHVFYNSVIFSSIAAYSYSITVVNEAFISSNEPVSPNITDSSNIERLRVLAANNSLEKLSPTNCIHAYGKNYQTTRSNLILIEEDNQLNQSYPIVETRAYDDFSWVCFQDPDRTRSCQDLLGGIIADSTGWHPYGAKIKYCLSEVAEEHCKLESVLSISILVVILNLLKAFLMCAAVFWLKELPLMTLGDALSSFLSRPDPSTKGMCLISGREVKSSKYGSYSTRPRAFHATPQRWYKAASRRRWAAFYFFYAIIIIVLAFLIYTCASSVSYASAIWKLGIGAVDPDALIHMNLQQWPVLAVLMANLGQLVLSSLYMLYNSIITSMMACHEWTKYALHRKGLRVSGIPRGKQRATYSLQLPYRVSIPLLGISSLLHWLVSQAIFVVSINVFSKHDGTSNNNIAEDSTQITCGYSPLAVILISTIGVVLFMALLAVSFKRFKSGMPVTACCSVVLSAACHPPTSTTIKSANDADEKEAVAFSEVKWGVVDVGDMYDGYNSSSSGDTRNFPPRRHPISHCAFSNQTVHLPEDGQLYS